MGPTFLKHIEAPWLPTSLAAAALALAAYNTVLARQRPAAATARPSPVAEANEPTRSVEAGRNELQLATIARLSDRLDKVEAELTKLKAQPPAAAGDAKREPIAAASAAPPRWKWFSVPGGITVRPAADGSLEVTNIDPALTGKRLNVEATADDGTIGHVDIVVPPPK